MIGVLATGGMACSAKPARMASDHAGPHWATEPERITHEGSSMLHMLPITSPSARPARVSAAMAA